MDRPARIGRLLDPDRGVFTIGSADVESLARLSLALFVRLQVNNASGFVAGMHLGGGGGGADWQVSYTVTQSTGMGFAGTSVILSKARVSFAAASDATELDRVTALLLAAIVAAAPDGNVYDVQIAGGGPDGAYLIGVLWGLFPDPPPYVREEKNPEQGPYVAETALLDNALQIQPTLNANDQVAYLVDWGAIIQEASNNGVFVRLQEFLGPAATGPWTTLRESEIMTGAGDWWTVGGVAEVLQPVSATDSRWLRLTGEGNTPSTITVRNAYLHALRAGDNGEIS